MRTRLRPTYSDEDLAAIYAAPHRHDQWVDHLVRVQATLALGPWLRSRGATSVADLSCGDATIARGLGMEHVLLGDYAPGYPFSGPLERNLDLIDHHDVYGCSETIEHLDDPDLALRKIRAKADHLILSTPIDETVEDGNPEHYWGWGVEDMREMLVAAGFDPQVEMVLRFPRMVYDFQIWGCA
jgi:hypothetical protein